MSNYSKKKDGLGIGRIIFRIVLVLIETIALLIGAVYAVGYIMVFGPSESARDKFVMSVRETSAIKFVANLYLTDEEIQEIEAGQNSDTLEATDASLITVKAYANTATQENDNSGESGTVSGPQPDEWGLIDEDGDGIIVEPVKGEGFSGYMMVVLDPSRVVMGSVPTSFGVRGYTVAEMVEHYDAVAGINAGGFYDPNGSGNGSIPDSMVVYEGNIYYADLGVGSGFVGLDDNYILHVGKFSRQDVIDQNIQYGVCFGPVLISNGTMAEPASLASGVNPRTAIGQRSDGAILMLVIDGRQVISIGATYEDIAKIMLRYGAVNAINLDGGSSTLMWYDGGYINNCASVIGIRPVPTTFLVLKESKINGN